MDDNKQSLWNDVHVEQVTFSVKADALRVGNRQMTQQVFFQLPEISPIDEESGRLLGKIWGNVNLRYQHIVWSDGSVLYRYDRMPVKYEGERIRSLLDALEVYLSARCLEGERWTWANDANDGYGGLRKKGSSIGVGSAIVDLGDSHFRAHFSEEAQKIMTSAETKHKLEQDAQSSNEYIAKHAMSELESLKSSYLVARKDALDSCQSFVKENLHLDDDVNVVLSSIILDFITEHQYAELEAYRNEYAKSVDIIKRAGQLFIGA